MMLSGNIQTSRQAVGPLLLTLCPKQNSPSVLASKAPSGPTGPCPFLTAPVLQSLGLCSLCASPQELSLLMSHHQAMHLTGLPPKGGPSLLVLFLPLSYYYYLKIFIIIYVCLSLYEC